MDNESLKVIAQTVGLGGVALALATRVFREVIRKKIFPSLTKAQAYRLLTLVVALAAVLGLAGIAAWTYVEVAAKPTVDAQTLADSLIDGLETPLDKLDCMDFCNEDGRSGILYAEITLGTLGANGDAILKVLQPRLDLLKSDRRFENCCPRLAARLYRAAGGARMLSERFDNPGAKFAQGGLPYFKRSLELDPQQADLRSALTSLEGFYDAGSVPIESYTRLVHQILRVDEQETEKLTKGARDHFFSPEQKALQWLLHEATHPLTISDFLKFNQLRLREERGHEFEIETQIQSEGDSVWRVVLSLGPNVWTWLVDLDRQKFTPGSYFTLQFEQFLTPVSGRENLARFWLVHEADDSILRALIGQTTQTLGVDDQDVERFRVSSRVVSSRLTRIQFDIAEQTVAWNVDPEAGEYFAANDAAARLMKSISDLNLTRYRGRSLIE